MGHQSRLGVLPAASGSVGQLQHRHVRAKSALAWPITRPNVTTVAETHCEYGTNPGRSTYARCRTGSHRLSHPASRRTLTRSLVRSACGSLRSRWALPCSSLPTVRFLGGTPDARAQAPCQSSRARAPGALDGKRTVASRGRSSASEDRPMRACSRRPGRPVRQPAGRRVRQRCGASGATTQPTTCCAVSATAV